MAEGTLRLAGGSGKPMPRKIGFTVSALDRAVCPSGRGRIYIYDIRTPGLTLLVTEAGAKSFYLYRKINGRPQRIRLGGYPDLSIELARRLASKTVGEIATGVDPMAEKRRARIKEMTVQELWDWYSEHYGAAKRSFKDDKQRYQTHIEPMLAKRSFKDVLHEDVQSLKRKVETTCTGATANRVLALLSVMYSKAAKGLGYTGINPCKGVDRAKEHDRERYLSTDELPKFFAALDDERTPQLWRDFFRMALLTGARCGNLQQMRWAEIDFGGAIWRIPGNKAKAGDVILVPLADEAMAILRRRRENAKSEWVFESEKKHGVCVHHPQKRWQEIIGRAGIESIRIHDLRRSLGSWMAQGGESLSVIGKTLGHRSLETTTIYARLHLVPVKAAISRAAAAMKAAVEAANATER